MKNIVYTIFITPDVCAGTQTSPDVNENIANFKALILKALKCEFLVEDAFALSCSGMLWKSGWQIEQTVQAVGNVRGKMILPPRCKKVLDVCSRKIWYHERKAARAAAAP